MIPIEVLVSGITQGAVYCVFAFGLSLVYGATRVLNFAHGSIYMTGAYLAWLLSAGGLGLGYPLTFLILIPILFLIGVGIERVVIQPLRARPDWKTATMMVTLGLAFVIDNANLILFGPGDKLLPPLVDGTVTVGGTVLSYHTIMVLVTALVIVILLELFLHRTRLGRAMRAVAQDQEGTAIVGIDANQIFRIAFGISTVLAGVAGVLLAPIYLISPYGGWSPFLKAFVIVVFGGLGSTRGVLYAAFVLGIIEAIVIFHLGASWTMPVWLVTLLVVLMVRPQGLLGVWAK
ncbi:MAG: branched-chain amino acid ABC transporter permease [Geminicoccaceae bacterium]